MTTITYTVKVASSKFTIDDALAPKLTFHDGDTYIFDQSDSSNAGNILQFSITDNNSGSAEYTTGVTKTGTAGSAGAKTTIVTSTSTTDTLYFYSSGGGTYGEEFSNSGFNTTSDGILKPIVGSADSSEKWGPMINHTIDQLVNKVDLAALEATTAAQGLGTGDSPSFAGGTFSGVVTAPYFAGTVQGIEWNESTDTYVRTGGLAGHPNSQTLPNSVLPIQAGMKRCVLSDAGVVQYYLDATDSTKKEDGTASVLTGGDGQVMLEIPKFYYKYGYSGTTHAWEISLVDQIGFTVHPAFNKNGVEVANRYIGAYEGIAWDASASAYADGDSFAGASGDKLSSVSGFSPWTNDTRAQFRAWSSARGTGWRQQDYDLVSAVQLLYLVEYADWNSQAMIGVGRTERTGTWVKDSYIGVTGKSNIDGNGTNSLGGDVNGSYMTYRGIENFFGNIWKWVDGINVNVNVPYVSNNDVDFADDTVTNYTNLGVTLAAANGYQKTLAQQSRGFLPASIGGASTTYIADYYYQAAGGRVVRLGGSAAYGAYAGVAAWAANAAASYVYVDIGGRLCF